MNIVFQWMASPADIKSASWGIPSHCMDLSLSLHADAT